MSDARSSQSGISRRTVLRGIGTAIALPSLESLRPATAAAAAAVPTRMAFLYVPNGVNVSRWRPEGEGRDYRLGPTLEPLADFRDDFQLISGLAHRNGTAGPDGAGDKPPRKGGRGFAGELRRRHVHGIGLVLKPVICLGDGSGAEGVRFDEVGPRFEVGRMDGAHRVWLGQDEEVVVAFQRSGVGGEPGAAEVLFGEPVALEHGAHGSVEDEDAVCSSGLQGSGADGDFLKSFRREQGGGHGCGCARSRRRARGTRLLIFPAAELG